MSFLTENSIGSWKHVSSRTRRPKPYFDRRSSWDAPSFDPHLALGKREKGIEGKGSSARGLTSLCLRPYMLQTGTFISQQVNQQPGTQIASSSARVPVAIRSRSSRSHDMGDIVKDLADVLPALHEVVPFLSDDRHKGQAGKIGVIGGCREYTGAPYYAAISALKIGADLSHVFCTQGAGTVIKSYSPELIVHPVLQESHDANAEDLSSQELVEKIVGYVGKWIATFDCLIIGPGLGRDELLLDTVAKIMQIARANDTPMVIDGDGLFLVTSRPDLVIGYPLAILTPNLREHKRLVSKMVDEKDGVPDDSPGQLQFLAKKMAGVTIMQKGQQDLISDGQSVISSDYFRSPRRCGGQGDVLSGSTAVFLAWAHHLFRNLDGKGAPKFVADIICSNPAVVGALAGSLLVRKAAADAFAKHGRSTLTTDIIEFLGPCMADFFPIQQF